ncbi:MAG TPA: fluoride efflux transporter CrcB [Rhizomicrobium sp.]|nr:fluoride efflux transporter CrcB [Rhizomicrobium sp.]
MTDRLPFYLLLALSGALGTLARYWLSGLVANAFGQTFPWDTIFVNVTGSFVIGFVATIIGPEGRILVGGSTRQLVMIGFCGGYTTFSAFSLQTLNLMNDGEWLYAGGNVAASVGLCLISVWLGAVAAAAINQLKGA